MSTRSYRGNEVAIVGIACAVPGAKDKNEFWHKLMRGEEMIRRFSDAELLELGVSEEIRSNKTYHGLDVAIENVDDFDHAFFNYLPREASAMDPQTRLFHKLVWQGLEDAGINTSNSNQVIGLYAAAGENAMWKNYTSIMKRDAFLDDITRNSLNEKENLAPLISYKLNLKGPAFNVHTACSSSALSTHIAVRNLLMGECKVAVAGGIRISNNHFPGYFHQDGDILSNDGHCRPFDENSSGTVPSDGAGVLVLKRLNDAIADNNQIYAIIKGSAVNNDGNRKVGYTAPSIDGQADCIKLARKIAKTEASTISYIEAHGTGTNLGDPVEIEGIVAGYQDLAEDLAIGSVKSNLGHCDTAAGVMGIIKTALCLHNRKLVPTANFTKASPRLNLEHYGIHVNSEYKDWTSSNGVLRAGVSSFGIGGTNAHLILEDMPQVESKEVANHLFPISAKCEASLEKMKGKLQDFLETNPEINLSNLAYTLQEGRTPFAYRDSFTGTNREELIESLSQSIGVTESKDLDKNEAVFMFSGQGTQYFKMGEALLDSNAVFKEWMNKGFIILDEVGLSDAKDLLYQKEELSEKINETQYTQPLLFIFEYALVKMLESFNIQPSRLIGHSVGEYVAACVSGVFSFEEGVKIMVKRGALMMKTTPGSMLSIALPKDDVVPLMNEELTIAATNTEHSCVVSGSENAVQKLADKLTSEGTSFVKLRTSHAFHSPMMDPILDEFETYLKGFRFSHPKIPFVSNLTGTQISNEDATRASYWRDHLRNEVKFMDGLNHLIASGETTFIEIGPGKALTSMVASLDREDLKLEAIHLVRHPKMKVSDAEFFKAALGKLWEVGFELDWSQLRETKKHQIISIPTYAFIESKYTTNYDTEKLLADLLGTANPSLQKQGNWFHYAAWKKLPSATISRDSLDKNIMFIGDQGIQLDTGKNRQITIRFGTTFSRVASDVFELNYKSEENWKDLFQSLKEEQFIPDVIVLAPAIEKYTESDAINAFFSLKQLMLQYGNESVETFILSKNAHQILPDESLQNPYSLLTGMGLVMTQEYHATKVRFIDVSAEITLEELQSTIETEIRISRNNGSTVAYRGGKSWIKSIENVELHAHRTNNLEGKSIVVIGGTGRSGLGLTEHLVNVHHAKVAVVGRRKHQELNETQQKVLEKSGNLSYFAADITQAEELRSVMDNIEQQNGEISGVLFLAANLGDENHSEIQQLTRSNFDKHYLPKVKGVNNLQEWFSGKKSLEFFWCASSLSSTLGGFRYASYASANAFLDTLSMNVTDFGKKVISVSLDGLAFDAGEDFPNLISNTELCEVFDTTFQETEVGNILVSKANINHQIQQFVIDRSIYIETQSTADEATIDKDASVEQQLIDLWQKVFENRAIHAHSNFYELGGNSLIGMRITNLYGKYLGIQFQLDQFLGNPTIYEQLSVIDAETTEDFEDIPVAPESELYPITDTQYRFWLLSQTEAGDLKYHINSKLRIAEEVNGTALKESLQSVVKRHEILRTTFHHDVETGQVFQKIHDDEQWVQVQVFDVSQSTNIDQELDDHWTKNILVPYDLENGPLLRVHVLKLEEQCYEIMYSLHHIVADGWSMELFKKELLEKYASLLKSEPKQLPKLKHQFKDFAVWVNAAINTNKFQDAQTFYRNELRGLTPIPFQPKGEINPSGLGREVVFNLSGTFTEGLDRITSNNAGSKYVSFAAAVGMVLHHLSGATQFAIGSSFAGRQHASLEHQLGPYLNTLPLKIEWSDEMNFGAYYSAIQARFHKMMKFQTYPLGNILKDVDSTGLFNVLVEYHSSYGFEKRNVRSGFVDANAISIEEKPIQFDLSFEFIEAPDNPVLLMTYDPALFTQQTIEVLKLRMEKIIHLIENETLIKDVDPDRQNLIRKETTEQEAF